MSVASFWNELKQIKNSRNDLLSEVMLFQKTSRLGQLVNDLSLINKKKQNLLRSSGCL